MSDGQAPEIEIRLDPRPGEAAFSALWRPSWGSEGRPPDWAFSLVHLGAYQGDLLVGYVNVATDGGVHAFLLDPTVHPDHRRRGLGRRLVTEAAKVSRERGAQWLHVDFEPQLQTFYEGCGFRPTLAGLIRLDE